MYVSAQNRGTEIIKSLNLEVTIDGNLSTLKSNNIEVGESVFKIFYLEKEKLTHGGEYEVRSIVRINGIKEDANSENNTRTSRIFIDPEN